VSRGNRFAKRSSEMERKCGFPADGEATTGACSGSDCVEGEIDILWLLACVFTLLAGSSDAYFMLSGMLRSGNRSTWACSVSRPESNCRGLVERVAVGRGTRCRETRNPERCGSSVGMWALHGSALRGETDLGTCRGVVGAGMKAEGTAECFSR